MSSISDNARIQAVFTEGVSAPLADEPCPTADQLWRALDPAEPFSAERYQVLNHCARCPSCAQDLQATKALIEDANALQTPNTQVASAQSLVEFGRPRWPRLVSQAPSSKAPDHRSWIRRNSAICATAAIAATLALIVIPKGEDSDATYRGEGDQTGLRSRNSDRQAPAKVEGYQYQAEHFAWPSVHGAQRYELLLFNSGFEQVCEYRAGTQTRVKLPPSACPRFDAAKPFYWKVRAIMPNAQRRESSFISQSPS